MYRAPIHIYHASYRDVDSCTRVVHRWAFDVLHVLIIEIYVVKGGWENIWFQIRVFSRLFNACCYIVFQEASFGVIYKHRIMTLFTQSTHKIAHFGSVKELWG